MATLIKTDRNGTQYWEDYTCPKCEGKGKIYCYSHVEGGICFLCNGSGCYRTHWKTYTPEYAAQLEERRAAKRQRKIDQFNAEMPEHYKELGLTAEGKCFAVLDRTFGRKDELKAAGARFNGDWWYFDHAAEGWNVAEVDARKLVEADVDKGRVFWDESKKGFETKAAVEKILKQRRVEANSRTISEFYGVEGDKVDAKVVLNKVFSFSSWDFRGEDCTMYGYKMSDNAGHHFVWVTGCDPWRVFGIATDVPGEECKWEREEYEAFYGKECTLKGRVKGHKEREGLKETQVFRCKLAF